jgi:hypothetical protein
LGPKALLLINQECAIIVATFKSGAAPGKDELMLDFFLLSLAKDSCAINDLDDQYHAIKVTNVF